MMYQINRNYLIVFLLLVVLIISIISGCGPAEPQVDLESGPSEPRPEEQAYPEPVSDSPSTDDAYPAPPTQTSVEASYPAPTIKSTPGAGYPSPGDIDDPNFIKVAIDRPIQPGSEMVTGVGPPGLNIFIFNITLMGELVGSGIIEQDGTFSIPTSPLEENVRIGLTTASAMGGQPDVGVQPGDGEMNIPQIGYFYDSLMVR